MKVERSAFVALTGLIAAGACATRTGGGAAGPENVVEVPLASASPVSSPSASSGVAWRQMSPSVEAPPPAPSEEGDDDYPADEGGPGTPVSANCGESGVAFLTTRSGCNDAQGGMQSCSSMKTPAGCGSFPFPRSKCDAYRRYFKPKIADAATVCAARISATSLCDACNTYRCGHAALMGACPDSSADSDCAAIVRSCRSVTLAECRSYLSGLNPAGRLKMVGCLTGSSGCGFGIYSCMESL